MTPQENVMYESIRREMDLLRADLAATRILSASNNSQPVSLPGQYIQKPIPARLGVEIHVPTLTTEQISEIPTLFFEDKIDIPSDGDFVATGFYIYFKFDVGATSQQAFGPGDVSGYWRYASSVRIPFFVLNPPFPPHSPVGIQDIYWEYEVSRTHQFRQNIPVPSSLLDMAEEGNGFFPIHQDIFPAGESVKIRIYPTHPLFVDMISGFSLTTWPGVFWCGFNGFYILGNTIPTM